VPLAARSCARDAVGGGGGLCVYLRRSVSLASVRFANNTATAGGGMFVQQRCLAGDSGCGPVTLTDSVFLGNTALGGGGGAVFRVTHNLTNVTCPGQRGPTPWAALHTACAE
jgi:hypothetical protein